ncbi:MAG TPA: Na+/H+ antiporter NhaA [Pseudonocardiaceae bacterium]
MTSSRPDFSLTRFLRAETVGGMILLGAAVVALVLENSPASDFYRSVRDFRLGPHLMHLNLAVDSWSGDGLLAIFFFVAGLELKRELVVGELSNRKAATLPVVAALAGMLVPAGVALAIGGGTTGFGQAWTIPLATDIAFALGVLALTGSAMPASARVFLLSLAVVDDLGAITVIAVVFTDTFKIVAALVAVALLALYAYLQHRRITSPFLYVPIALATWVAVHDAGVHATVAGVALGLLTRVKPDPHELESPAERLEHRLQPWSASLAVPIFALFAAGVPVTGESLKALVHDRIAIAIMAGLVIGKLVGILGGAALAVVSGVAVRPAGLSWRDLAAVATLGGVGFTVSLLLADLALPAGEAAQAKTAVLLASAASALAAGAMLIRRGRRHKTQD